MTLDNGTTRTRSSTLSWFTASTATDGGWRWNNLQWKRMEMTTWIVLVHHKQLQLKRNFGTLRTPPSSLLPTKGAATTAVAAMVWVVAPPILPMEYVLGPGLTPFPNKWNTTMMPALRWKSIMSRMKWNSWDSNAPEKVTQDVIVGNLMSTSNLPMCWKQHCQHKKHSLHSRYRKIWRRDDYY